MNNTECILHLGLQLMISFIIDKFSKNVHPKFPEPCVVFRYIQ